MRGKGGRPPSKPVVFRDGFYIEVRNRATDPGSGIKIRKETYEEMMAAVEEYRKTKLVVILGKYKNGEPVSLKPESGKPVTVKKKKK
ncbi:MAG: hypothetical protein HY840_09860 [Bacteroidetes bacterium]|nr:hypothetical protein [Bacteroidota bacterium]